MNRRKFVTTAGTAFAMTGAGKLIADEHSVKTETEAESGKKNFKMHFAPSARHFGGGKTIGAYLDCMKKAHDAGFTAWEDNWLVRRPAAEQEKIGEFLKDKAMTMGVSVVTTGDAARWFEATEEETAKILDDCHKAVACAQRVGHRWFTLIPGARYEKKPFENQLDGAIDLLKKCCDIFEPANLVFVMEPLSHDMGKRPVLLRTFKDGYDLCKKVNRPACKLLADYYHQQQVGGDLLKNTDECWDEIAYVQYGDVPGRKQPGTGEINYANVTKHLRDKGYTGVIGLEHGIEGTSEDLIAAYRNIDDQL